MSPKTDYETTERAIEALLFAAAGPLSAAELAYRLPEGAEVGKALAGLKAQYTGRGVSLECINDRWQFRTASDLAYLMVEEREEPRKLSKAALETLAIIAYHQPVTRAEIEVIRGVGLSKGTVDVLMEMGLIRLRGRRKSPGRPVTYGTTEFFLEAFTLSSLNDLPGVAEMRAAGLLDMNVPADFMIPTPTPIGGDEDDNRDVDAAQFVQDFMSDEPNAS